MSEVIELSPKERYDLERLLAHHTDSRQFHRALALILLDAGQARAILAAVKRGLKHGLWTHKRTVALMLDETIITEAPPPYVSYGRIGQQVDVPIPGNRAKYL